MARKPIAPVLALAGCLFAIFAPPTSLDMNVLGLVLWLLFVMW